MLSDEDWELIVSTIRDGDCVPFLGAGASMGFTAGRGLPTGRQLADEIATDSRYQGRERDDFLRVCQHFEMKKGVLKLRDFIIRRLKDPNAEPSRIHRELAKLPITHVLTTNYDNMMERAFAELSDPPKRAHVINHDFRGKNTAIVPDAAVDSPVIYKLHGGLDQPASMVCTEDDVVHFLAGLIHDQPPLPAPIRLLFQARSLLFIGYGLRDWNIRVMLRTLRWDNPQDFVKSFAIQKRPTEALDAFDFDHTVVYWDRREGIRCFDQDAEAFIVQLASKYEASLGAG